MKRSDFKIGEYMFLHYDNDRRHYIIQKETPYDKWIAWDVKDGIWNAKYRKDVAFSDGYSNSYYRAATQEEIDHLNQCIEAGKYVEYIKKEPVVNNCYSIF